MRTRCVSVVLHPQCCLSCPLLIHYCPIQTSVIDHMHYDVLGDSGDHLLVVAADPVSSPVMLGKGPSAPVLFRYSTGTVLCWSGVGCPRCSLLLSLILRVFGTVPVMYLTVICV